MTHPRKLYQSLAIICLTAIAACDNSPTELRMLLPSSTLDAGIAADLSAILSEGSRFAIHVTDEATPGEYALDLLASGQADLALVSNYLPYRDGISTVMPVYPSVLHIAYKQGRDVSTGINLLQGADIDAGVDGSASRLVFIRIARRIGLADNDFSFIEGPAAAAPTDTDVLIRFAPISPQLAESLVGFQLYSLGVPAEIGSGSVADAAALINPPLRPFIIPATTYGRVNPEAVVTVAVDKILVARSDLDASTVYDLIEEIWRARPALAASRPGTFETNEQVFDVSKSTFVLHAGTQDYLRRDEPTVYERYSGVAEVLVTLMIALVSASFAAVRFLRIRRKNRIDEFYSAALQLRNELASASSAEATESAILRLRALQDQAFAQLVDERLSADESFRIFITLSNDILGQYTQDTS
jgi:TRAP-type uncharacterized transport system substrate-binding protein